MNPFAIPQHSVGFTNIPVNMLRVKTFFDLITDQWGNDIQDSDDDHVTYSIKFIFGLNEDPIVWRYATRGRRDADISWLISNYTDTAPIRVVSSLI